jgi:RNAse (barnase) inhibitor barstar
VIIQEFILASYFVRILEAMWAFIFSNYKRWQFITAISVAHKEYSNQLFRVYTSTAKILKIKGLARLKIEKQTNFISIIYRGYILQFHATGSNFSSILQFLD